MKLKKILIICVAIVLGFLSTGIPVQANEDDSMIDVLLLLMMANRNNDTVETSVPTVAAEFNPSVVYTGDATTLTVTLTNPLPEPLGGLGIDNVLPGGLILDAGASSNTCDTTPFVQANNGIYNLTDFTIEANSDCVVTMAISATSTNTPGTLNFSTSNFTDGTDTFNNASASLTIASVESPTVTASFSPATIFSNEESTLTVTLSNPNPLALEGISIENHLPAGLAIDAGQSSNTCDASPSINASSGIYDITDVTLQASSDCIITLAITDIDINDVGLQSFSTGNFTDGLNVFSNATADLTINAAPDPSVTAYFSPNEILATETTTLIVRISNPQTTPLNNVNIVNDLPAGLTLNESQSSATCDVTPQFNAPSGIFNVTDATMPASSTCTITIAVTGITNADVGFKVFSTSGFEANGISYPDATASLGIFDQFPTITGAFDKSEYELGEAGTVTFTLKNLGSLTLTGVNFSANLEGGYDLDEAASSSTCDATPEAINSTNRYNITDATIPAGTTCTHTVAFVTTAAGTWTNIWGALITDQGTFPAPVTAQPEITPVPPLTITGVFDAASYEVGATGTVTFTIENPALTDYTGVSFSANLEGGYDLDAAASASTCDATPEAINSTNRYNITDATIPAGTTCTHTVAFVTTDAGTPTNIWGALITDQGTFPGPVTAQPEITPAPPLTITGVFDAASYEVGATGTATFTIENPALIDYTGVNFSANLEGGYDLDAAASTSTCDATPEAINSTNRYNITDATIPAGTTCTHTVAFVTTAAGTWTNIWGALITDQGTFPGPVTAQPEITPAPPLTITGVFDAGSYALGATGTVTFTIENPALIDYTGVSFSANLEGGYDLDAAASASTCDDTPEAINSTNRYNITDATIPAGTTCTHTVAFVATDAGAWSNIWGALITDQGTFPGPVTAQPEITPTTVTSSASFDVSSLLVSETGTLTITIDNPANVALTGVTFTADLPAALDLNVAGSLASCDTSPFVDGVTEEFGLTFASIDANSSCTLTIDFTATATGSFTPVLSDITTGNSGDYPAPVIGSLTVTEPAPTVTGGFVPNPVGVGNPVDLVFSIQNNAGSAITIVEFGNELPPELPLIAKTSSATCDASPDEDIGANTFILTNATLAAGATCTVTIKAQALQSGTFAPNTGNLETSIGNFSVAPVAVLTVDK